MFLILRLIVPVVDDRQQIRLDLILSQTM